MKVHVDIDCTPEEARVFFGLPDVQEQLQRMFWQQVGAAGGPGDKSKK